MADPHIHRYVRTYIQTYMNTRYVHNCVHLGMIQSSPSALSNIYHNVVLSTHIQGELDPVQKNVQTIPLSLSMEKTTLKSNSPTFIELCRQE